MATKLGGRIFSTIFGAVVGFFVGFCVLTVLSTLLPSIGERFGRIFYELCVGYASGTILVLAANVLDTTRKGPRNYWFFGMRKAQCMSSYECFVFGALAPFYTLLPFMSYFIGVATRKSVV